MPEPQFRDTDSASSPRENTYRHEEDGLFDYGFVEIASHALGDIAVSVDLDDITLISGQLVDSIYLPNDTDNLEFKYTRWIHEFRDEPYRVIRPIRVTYRTCHPSGVEASFQEANIAWVGEDEDDAFDGLQAEILNTFEDNEEHEDQLGPDPRRQLLLLRSFIEKAT